MDWSILLGSVPRPSPLCEISNVSLPRTIKLRNAKGLGTDATILQWLY